MTSQQIRIEKIKVKALYEFACNVDDRFKENNTIPITKHRALAHANNPCADENDIGLLVAYIGRQCIGYLGIMPGLLKKGNHCSKIYWLSAWYVSPEYRKTSVALLLVMKAFSLQYDLLAYGMQTITEKLCRGLGFHEVSTPNYYAIDLRRMNFLALPFLLFQKFSSEGSIKTRITDLSIAVSQSFFSPLKSIFYRLLLKYQESDIENITFKEVNEISKEAIELSGHNEPTTEFYRGRDIINWMLQYKWDPELDNAEERYSNYRFSNIFGFFKFIALDVYSANGKDYKGFLVLSVSLKKSTTILKILDFHFCHHADEKYILSITFKYAKDYLADYIILPYSLAVHCENKYRLRLLMNKKKHICLCRPKSKNSLLATSLHEINLKYCDGDIPFV